MKKRSIGIKRTITVLSAISIAVWIVVSFILLTNRDNFGCFGLTIQEIILIVSIISFGSLVIHTVFVLVCEVIYWVLDGFRQDKLQ